MQVSFRRLDEIHAAVIDDSFTFLSFLGRNQDYPVSNCRAVDGRGTGIFEDINRLNIVRVEVIKRAALEATPKISRHGVVFRRRISCNRESVNDIQRAAVASRRDGTANADGECTARLGCVA